MSTPHFKPIPGSSPVEVLPVYRQADSTLIVGPNGSIPLSMYRLSIDTLTLSFHPANRMLIGLDAYTNYRRWERRPLTAPAIDQEVALSCIDVFDIHGIGESGADSVQYIYYQEKALLLIKLVGNQVMEYIRCLSCVTCGLGANSELIEIWVQGLDINQDESSKKSELRKSHNKGQSTQSSASSG